MFAITVLFWNITMTNISINVVSMTMYTLLLNLLHYCFLYFMITMYTYKLKIISKHTFKLKAMILLIQILILCLNFVMQRCIYTNTHTPD